jgi:endo-1,4-beta-D-glucanase Y
MMQHTIRLGSRTTLWVLASTALAPALWGCTTSKEVVVVQADGGATSCAPTDAAGSHSDAASSGMALQDAASDTSVAPPTRGPTPATSTTAFPFPQNRQKPGLLYPTNYLNSDVEAAYAKWKADLVVSDGGFQRIQRTASDSMGPCIPQGSTVSEGIGYGMLIAVYMGDQSLFDDLWQYEQQHLDGTTKLMNWAPNGSSDPMNGCTGPAPDADEDMAFALVMADKQWGGQGSLSQSYKAAAAAQIHAIWTWEVSQYKWLTAGVSTDQHGWANNAQENISYFAPAYYRTFAQVAVDPMACAQGVDPSSANPQCDGWWNVIAQSYATINDALNSANGNQSNGLVPGWCDDSAGAPCKATANASSSQPFYYQADACRTPFRVGLDAFWNGYAAAQSYVAKTTSFFVPIGAAQILDAYNLDGTQNSHAHPGTHSAAFVGPATVGAMGSASNATNQAFIDDGYGLLVQDNAFQSGEYYDSSWTVMSLLMLTGNFLDYTQETPAH